jgi:8-oxo-dGTP pyrophosphatase MutT (NUDIX family)
MNEIQLASILEVFRNVREIKNVFFIHDDPEKVFQEFQTFFRKVEAAGGLVTTENNRFLVIKRKGKWDLPKGKMEPGEEPKTCALREVKEECGINTPEIDDLLQITYHSYTLDGILILKKTYWYRMTYRGDEKLQPQKKEDITDVRWMKPEEVETVSQNTYGSIMDVLGAAELI